MQEAERAGAPMSLRRLARALGLAVAVSAAAGCTSLPDAGPFVDATSQYRSAIVASGGAIEGELREIRATGQADRFAREWSVRIRAADALVAYSRSLAAIVAAGNEGAASARKVAESVTTLAGAAGVVLPAAPVVGTVTDVAAFVYGQVASIRASSALAEAMQAAVPAVDQIANIMAKDLLAAESILRAASEVAALDLATRYNTEISHYTLLVNERNAIYKSPALTRQQEERLLQLDRLIAATRVWRDGMEAEERAIAARLRAGRQLIGATRQGLQAWALAHRDLAAAVAEGRKVDPAALLAAVGEIRELVRRVQSL